MPRCQFSTIRAVPHNPGSHASANVGVILYDPGENIAYRKLTDNWREVRRITGFRYNPGSAEAAEQGPFGVEDDYLANLAKGQFMDSLRVTPPKSLMPFDTHEEALRWAYNSQVHIAALAGGKDGRADPADVRLKERILGARFPRGCYRRAHRFDLERPPAMRFPNVFFADGRPYRALFAVSLDAPGAYAAVKRRICEAETIKRQASTPPTFGMCTMQTGRQIDRGRPYVGNILDLARAWGVDSIHWDALDGELAEIRSAVSPPGLQAAGRGAPVLP